MSPPFWPLSTLTAKKRASDSSCAAELLGIGNESHWNGDIRWRNAPGDVASPTGRGRSACLRGWDGGEQPVYRLVLL